MVNKDKSPAQDVPPASAEHALRRHAEEIAKRKKALSSKNLETLTPEAMRQTLHELQVHQIELEMQNEELRRAQEELTASRARYFDLYDLAPVGYCTVSEQGLILEANFTAASLLGVARSELVKRPISRFILKANQDIYYLCRKQLLEASETSEAQSCELQMVKHDGTPFWAHLALTAAQDDDGAPTLRLVLSDVSQHRRMEAAMQESEERFRTLIEGTPEPIAVHRHGRLIYANPAAIKLLGANSAQDLIGKPLLDLVHPDFHQTVLARATSMTLHGGRSPMVEKKFLKLDGTPIDVEVQSTSIAYDGEPAIQIAMRDITARKHLDQVLQEYNDELEQARHVAEKANLAKSDFLSSMSHELRSPLNAILGFAQLLESGEPVPTPGQKTKIDQIIRAGWYLLELINGILDLALIESGKLSLSLEPISLNDVLLDCQAMIEPQAQNRGIRISFPLFDSAFFVNADRTRLKQVVVNLLSNAIKYNKAGGTVEVTCSEVTAGRLRISVQDSGEGLSPEKLDQLFQPFNRLGQEASAEEGTGIGLVVSRRLVELMEGEIGAHSTVGVGSVFWVELNLAAAPQLGPGAAEPPTPMQAPVQPGAVLRTLLYVEDNRANMELVKQLVARRPDMRLLGAEDGARGIALARTHQPQVILMDINLPGISGLQALKILREDPATRHIPVLALSANAMPRDIAKGLEAGFFRYLTKPIKVNAFMEVLDMALEFARTQSARMEHEKQTGES
ncbi:PAS domain-containing sensor histidine kinase [Rhodoferax sp. UBA5149]|uniref:PAS domain-containing sensor histidine kinase n=1 Tax=Rhodoferax sp. UBA5149 TaxID=1947379 RepID=UPI0025E2F7AB|nr:PAS domain-containing sensor histidine kinase [Rhodoferax sp. UBA5149]